MKIKNSHKLSHHEQHQIKQWLAEDWGISEILKRLKEDFGKEVSQPALSYYSHFYAKEIQIIRDKINTEVENVPISQKVVRQRRREEILKRYMSKGELEKAREVLNEAAKEMEVKTPLISMQQNNNNQETNIFENLPKEEVSEIDELFRAIIERSHAKKLGALEFAAQSN